MKKIVTIIGTRPQFIKMALVSKALKSQSIKETILHTGQHYNRNMSDIFFTELKIPKPDYNLGAGSGPHAAQLAKMLIGIDKILKKERPDIVMVYGDTNSTLAGAIAAAKFNTKIAHVEAGLRSFDMTMPEEVNRIITDAVTNIFLCPTTTAIANLRREGKTENVHLVGDVMYDSIKLFFPRVDTALRGDNYILCTIHRAENTDDPANLKSIFKALGIINQKIILPLHPRTEGHIKKYRIAVPVNVEIVKPVGYHQMLILERNACLILTDSGGVQKEAIILGVPCVTLRRVTEWVETVKSGANILAGPDTRKIVSAVKSFSGWRRRINPRKLYGNGRAHEKIAAILEKELKKE